MNGLKISSANCQNIVLILFLSNLKKVPETCSFIYCKIKKIHFIWVSTSFEYTQKDQIKKSTRNLPTYFCKN